MTIHEASRTLLKSPPELWAECSDASSLNRHLDQFGEIRITRLEPETAVAWEGENASGTVRLEPSGWGTRVILTAEEVDPVVKQSPPPVAVVTESEPAVVEADPEPEPAAVQPEREPELAADQPEPEPEPEPQAVEPEPVAPEPPVVAPASALPAPRGGFFARLMARMRGPVPVVDAPAPDSVAEPALEPEAVAAPEVMAAPEVVAEPEALAEPEPIAEPEAAREPEAVASPEPIAESGPAPEPSAPTANTTLEALTGALESLGMAHHRPFSRS